MKSKLKCLTGLVFVAFLFSGCANAPCKIEERVPVAIEGNQKSMTANKDLTTRVRVYKPDGSLQCGMGKKVEPAIMAKELQGVEVFSAENKHDGLMRIQVCGQPTGTNNVYEIREADLEKALKLGFKKWIHE